MCNSKFNKNNFIKFIDFNNISAKKPLWLFSNLISSNCLIKSNLSNPIPRSQVILIFLFFSQELQVLITLKSRKNGSLFSKHFEYSSKNISLLTLCKYRCYALRTFERYFKFMGFVQVEKEGILTTADLRKTTFFDQLFSLEPK